MHSPERDVIQNMIPQVQVMFLVTLIFNSVNSQNEQGNQENRNENGRPPIQLDPKLRRALLRVLNKLEEEDKTVLQQEVVKEQNNPSMNIVTEEDFIKYFNNKETQEQLFGQVDSSGESARVNDEGNVKIDQHYKRAPVEQIKFNLYEASPNNNEEVQQPDIRAGGTYTREIAQSTIEEIKEPNTQEIFINEKEKFPSTNPTPQEAIFFQVPHPVEIPDSASEKPLNDTLNVQETKYLQNLTPETNEFNNNNNNNGDEQKDADEEQGKTIVESTKSNEESVVENSDDEDDVDNKNSTKKLKHDVEFLHSSLLAAFTVQQDQQGLPRRVIPLNYRNNGGAPIPLPKIDPQAEQLKRQRELEEKQKILEQQLFEQQRRLKVLQYQQSLQRQNGLINTPTETTQFHNFQTERPFLQNQQPVFFDEQQTFLQNQQRQQLLEQREKDRLILLEQTRLRQQQQDILLGNQQREEQQRLALLKEQEKIRLLQEEEQRRQQQFQLQNQQPNNVNFQKSVDFQFRPSQPLPQNTVQNFPTTLNNFPQISPLQSFNNFQPSQSSVELNRVNRGESSRFVGNFGFNNNLQQNPDSHLQNLIYQSGVTNDLQSATHEDLNIVTKVLALNHDVKGQPLPAQQQFRVQNQQQTFVPNEQFRTNAQQFRSNELQFRPNDIQFNRPREQFRSNSPFSHSILTTQFRPAEQIFGDHSLKVNSVVRAPSLVIEPPLP